MMEVKALKEAITNIHYSRHLMETYDFRFGHSESIEHFKKQVERCEYDISAIIGEVTTNNILHPKEMKSYYKQLFRMVREQRHLVKSLTYHPTYEMKTNNDVNTAVFQFRTYAENFVSKIAVLIPSDIEEELQEEAPDNLYTLDTINSKLLYYRFSHLVPLLAEDIKKGRITKAQISRELSYLLNTTFKNLQPLMGNLLHFNINETRNTPYKIEAVEQALKALDDSQVDSPELREIYSQLLKKKKAKNSD